MSHEEIMDRYLRRLSITTRPKPSRQLLNGLVEAHLKAVPFENLDIVNGLRPELTTAGALEKIACRRRGGFCYELNEAFRALLDYLGFEVIRIEARVWLEQQGRFGPPYDHLALLVTLPDGEFLTDVGFGDNNRTPMRFPKDSLQDISGLYALVQASESVWVLSRSDRVLYEMTLKAQPLSAFTPMCRYHQTSPDSIFAKGILCTRATVNGRVTLSRDRLTVVDGTLQNETMRPDRDAVLEQYFGIVAGGMTC
jgi:N-hydroxyarylamine O-acetyltransferase